MRNLYLLIKNYFLCFIGNISSKRKGGRYSAALLIIAASSFLFIYLFSNMALLSIETAIKYEQEMHEPVIAYSALLSSAVLAMMFMLLIVFSKSSTPSKSNDENMLLALPIKKTTIIISKIIYNYFFDLGMVLVTLFPSYVVYYIKVPNASFMVIIRGLILVLLLPLVANAIATLLSLFFQKISAGYRMSKIIQTIISLLSISLFLVGYYGMLYLSESNAEKMMEFMTKLHFVNWMVSFTLMDASGILSLFFICLVCIIPFALSIYFQVKALGKKTDNVKHHKETLTYKPQPVYQALFKKEMNRYISTPIYVTNTIFGGLFAIIIAVIVAILGKDFFYNLLQTAEINIPNFDILIDVSIVLIIVMMGSTICLTASSISLEGKNLWIIKAHPIEPMDVFTSKILVNLVVGLIPLGLSITIISFVIGIYYLPVLLMIIIAFLFGVAVIGLLLNLAFPRFEWDSELVPVKQGISVGLALLINFLFAIIPFALGIILQINGVQTMFVFIIIAISYLIIDLILYQILRTKGVKTFKTL